MAGFTDIVPYLTHPLALVGYMIMVVFSFLRALSRSPKIPTLGVRAGARIFEQAVRVGLLAALLCIVGGISLAFLESSQRPDIYRIRVTVLSSDGAVVDDARLASSVGGDLRAGGSIYELVVPASLRPAGGRVIICAQRGPETGSVEVILDEQDFLPVVILHLVNKETTTTIQPTKTARLTTVRPPPSQLFIGPFRPAPEDAPPRVACIPPSDCCMVCKKGKACGDACISRNKICHKERGCACNSWEVCG